MATNGKEHVLTDDERQVLARICREVGVPADIIEEMIAAENAVYGMGRRHGIWENLEGLVTKGLGSQTQEAQQ